MHACTRTHAHTHGEEAESLQLWWGCEQAPTILQKLRTPHTRHLRGPDPRPGMETAPEGRALGVVRTGHRKQRGGCRGLGEAATGRSFSSTGGRRWGWPHGRGRMLNASELHTYTGEDGNCHVEFTAIILKSEKAKGTQGNQTGGHRRQSQECPQQHHSQARTGAPPAPPMRAHG